MKSGGVQMRRVVACFMCTAILLAAPQGFAVVNTRTIAPISLSEQIKTADYVVHAVIIAELPLEFVQDSERKYCAFNYRAQILHSYQGAKGKHITFSSDRQLPLKREVLLLLEDATKVTSESAIIEDEVYRDISKDLRQCRKRRLSISLPIMRRSIFPVVGIENSAGKTDRWLRFDEGETSVPAGFPPPVAESCRDVGTCIAHETARVPWPAIEKAIPRWVQE